MENYLGILRVLGAASFGLGGITFLLSFRWRMDGLKLVRHHIRWDASVITIIAISAALNAGLDGSASGRGRQLLLCWESSLGYPGPLGRAWEM